jgi:hypothetical protein
VVYIYSNAVPFLNIPVLPFFCSSKRGSDKKLKIWDVNSKQCLNTNESHTDQVHFVVYGAHNVLLAMLTFSLFPAELARCGKLLSTAMELNWLR